MPWAKFDDDLLTNPKFMTVGAEAKLLYMSSIVHCAKALTDGMVQQRVALSIARLVGISDFATASEELVDAELWEITDGGWQIHDYLEYNPSREKVLAERDEARERMSKVRSRDVRPNIERTEQEPTENLIFPVPVPVPMNNMCVCDDVETADVETVDKPKAEYSDDFEQFWQNYPRKIAKKEAYRAWTARLKGGALPGDMVSAAEHYAEYCEQRHAETQYIKHAATFLGPDLHFRDYITGIPEPVKIPPPRTNGAARASPSPPAWVDDYDDAAELARTTAYLAKLGVSHDSS